MLGVVSAVRPSLMQLEREEFDGRLAFRIESPATDEALAAAIRTAGEVHAVKFEEPISVDVAAWAATARSGSTSAGWTG